MESVNSIFTRLWIQFRLHLHNKQLFVSHRFNLGLLYCYFNYLRRSQSWDETSYFFGFKTQLFWLYSQIYFMHNLFYWVVFTKIRETFVKRCDRSQTWKSFLLNGIQKLILFVVQNFRSEKKVNKFQNCISKNKIMSKNLIVNINLIAFFQC